MLILRADHTIVSLAVLGCVSYCQCQVRAVQAKLLPTLLYWRLKAAPVGRKSPRHEAQMVNYLLPTKAAQLFPPA